MPAAVTASSLRTSTGTARTETLRETVDSVAAKVGDVILVRGRCAGGGLGSATVIEVPAP